MKHLKTYENIRAEFNLEDLKVGDIWKGDLNYDKNKWWVIVEMDFKTPNFWTNIYNKIKIVYIDLDNVDKLKLNNNFNVFDYMTTFTPESELKFSNITYNIRKLWDDNPKALLIIANMFLGSKNNKHVVDIWFKKVPELEFELEAEKYNL